jgi:hypothetical protein
MDWSVFTVYTSPFTKRRIGREGDGGYVICDISDCSYDLVIGAGVCDDISFEEDFLRSVQNVPCITFDGTIENLPYESKGISFIKKNIGRKESETTTNLHELLMSHSNVFIKMDIEGAEYNWLHSLKQEHLDRIAQLTLEIHYPFKSYTPIFKKLNETHCLFHLHANNAGGTTEYEGMICPGLIECTYVNRKWLNPTFSLQHNTESIPGPLDMPNLAEHPDISLNYPPFCWPCGKE